MDNSIRKILLFEDNAGDAELIKEMLGSPELQYRLKTADRLLTGLKILEEETFDVILLDLGLPDSSGIDTLRKMRGQSPAVPVIVLTGIADEELAQQAIEIGAQDYLTKGQIDNQTLVRSIRYSIHRWKAEERIRKLNLDLAQRNAELDAERARWQGVVEGIADEVWVCDMQGKMSLINLPEVTAMGLEEFTDVSLEGVMEEVEILAPDGQPRPLEDAPLLRSLRGEVVRGEEIMRHRKTGRTRCRQFSSAPIRDASGTITGAVAIVRDITEHKRAEEQLKKTLEDLERSNRELEQFAYVASHDLKEPLRMMSSFAQMLALEYKGRLDEDADQYINVVVEGSKRMNSIIEDLLTYSRMGAPGLSLTRTDCNNTVKQAISHLSAAIEESGALIHTGDLPILNADEGQFSLLFQNLLSNAVKFRNNNTVPVIDITSERRGNEWVFSVLDNGIGIDPRYFDNIFAIFKRLHRKEEYPGTGIGLAICKRIVEKHGGRIWVESKPGEGSAFYFTIPVQ